MSDKLRDGSQAAGSILAITGSMFVLGAQDRFDFLVALIQSAFDSTRPGIDSVINCTDDFMKSLESIVTSFRLRFLSSKAK